jgi:hypothetical protein
MTKDQVNSGVRNIAVWYQSAQGDRGAEQSGHQNLNLPQLHHSCTDMLHP